MGKETELVMHILKTGFDGGVATAGGSLLMYGFEKATDSANISKVAEDLSKVLSSVKKIQTSVDEMSQKLDQGFLQLRKDSLNSYVTAIKTMWNEFMGFSKAVDKLTANKTLTSEEAAQLAALQKTMRDTLKVAIASGPAGVVYNLDQVNEYLMDKTFVKEAAKQAWKSSNDFVSYYLKMKTLVMPWWNTMANGVMLLQIAAIVMPKEFSQWDQTIPRQQAQLQAQENLFRSTIGENTCSLAEMVIQNNRLPSPKRTGIKWQTGWGSGIIERPQIDPEHKQSRPWPWNIPMAEDGTRFRWGLQADPTWKRDWEDPTETYPLQMRADGSGDLLTTIKELGYQRVYLLDEASYQRQQMRSASVLWRMHPTAPGADTYRFRLELDQDRYLVTTFAEPWMNAVGYKNGFNEEEDYMGRKDRIYFKVEIWKD